MKRWVGILLIAILLVFPLFAHKMPVVEYTYVGHIWEEAYEKIPKNPVIDEPITLQASVVHPNETIEGNVTSVFAVYEDNTEWEWYGGEPYKNPDWLVLLDEPGKPLGDNTFEVSLVIDRPGSYKVFIDWYEDRQFIGQSMHTLDVERRTLGPMFYVLNGLLILGVLIGVRRGVI